MFFSTTLRFISNDSFARSIMRPSRSKNSDFVFDKYPSRGILIVTTPTLPVISADPNKPPPRTRSSRRSSWSRQHILRTSLGFSDELTKFWKYGMQYFAVISNNSWAFSFSQSKSFVMLYVGIGKVNVRPL